MSIPRVIFRWILWGNSRGIPQFIEINTRKKKWLLCCSYNPHRNNISIHIPHLSKALDNYISHYDNILFLGDFNFQPSENCVNDFCNVFIISNVFQEPTCFKNPDNPSCIDLLLNKPSKKFSKHYDDGNRYLRFLQNGNYSFENFLEEAKTKNHSVQKL